MKFPDSPSLLQKCHNHQNPRKRWERVRDWFSNRENLLLVALIVIHLIPIWAFDYFPSQDGPAHINNANVIREYDHPDRTVFREYYVLNESIDPTWFTHLILAGLMAVFSMSLAEKIFLSGYVILLPVSVRYALCAIRPGAAFLAILAFPFIYSFTFHLGFYAFSYSLVMFFFVMGYWLKYQEAFTWRRAVTFSGLLLLLYFCHIVSLAMICRAIALLTAVIIVRDAISQSKAQKFNITILWKIVRHRAFPPFLAFLPALALVAFFVLPRTVVIGAAHPYYGLLKNFLVLDSLVSYDAREMWFSALLVLLLAAIFCWIIFSKIVHRRVDFRDSLLLLTFVYVGVYFLVRDTLLISPNGMVGGGMMKERLNFYPFFALILWFAATPFPQKMKSAIQVIALCIILCLGGLRMAKYAELNDYLKEYLSGAELIEPNKTLLPLAFSQRGHTSDGCELSHRVSPFLHTAGYIAAQRGVVEFSNYEANLGYFPTIFRRNLNPYTHICHGEELLGLPFPIDFLTYPQRTGGHVDYVLVWGLREHQKDSKDTKSILQQLKSGYDLIYTSPQRGLMQLYQRKE